MPRTLLLRLEAPLMSFGGDAVDAYGVVRDLPARSMVTGLIANALGWERHEGERHDRLQRRLAMATLRVREGQRMRDFQTARLGAGDRGWTTHGRVEGRAGGAATYQSPHIRYRDLDADALVLVALRLEPAEDAPDLDAVAAALDRPARPLFLGRKPFLPSGPIALPIVEAQSLTAALREAARSCVTDPDSESWRAQWPAGEDDAADAAARPIELTHDRDWVVGVHSGLDRVCQGWIAGAAP